MEGDGSDLLIDAVVCKISIHSLRMEGDGRSVACLRPECHFNPLPPHGGRHYEMYRLDIRTLHFNPLPPHGGRLVVLQIVILRKVFQSTPSAWRETICGYNENQFTGISIHSLRMEGDRWSVGYGI